VIDLLSVMAKKTAAFRQRMNLLPKLTIACYAESSLSIFAASALIASGYGSVAWVRGLVFKGA